MGSMASKNLTDLSEELLRGRRVLVRVDYNVPLEPSGEVGDTNRIEETLPTLRLLMERGARIVLLAHLGRPDGAPDPRYSLQPVARALSRLLDHPVGFSPDTVGEGAEAAVARLDNGHILLLENTRFLPGETRNDPELARRLGELGDHFVNDAFGAAHRAHASTEGVARVIRERGGEAVAGLLMERELRFLGMVLENPERPFVAILGGAKISGKIDVIEAILPRVDRLLIGGAMANTFFRAMGLDTGKSLVEEDRVEMARDLLERGGDRILLPVDTVVASEIAADARAVSRGRDAVGADDRVGDIGPESVALFTQEIAGARTILWNGPMGVFEMEPFARGTMAVARAVADAADGGATVVVGGGDSAAAADEAGVVDRLTHVSTGGGASLEFLAGEELPGVAALTPRETTP
jgi:phosphoglycerate kinase